MNEWRCITVRQVLKDLSRQQEVPPFPHHNIIIMMNMRVGILNAGNGIMSVAV